MKKIKIDVLAQNRKSYPTGLSLKEMDERMEEYKFNPIPYGAYRLRVEGYKYGEIAEKLGITKTCAKVRCYEAWRKLHFTETVYGRYWGGLSMRIFNIMQNGDIVTLEGVKWLIEKESKPGKGIRNMGPKSLKQLEDWLAAKLASGEPAPVYNDKTHDYEKA